MSQEWDELLNTLEYKLGQTQDRRADLLDEVRRRANANVDAEVAGKDYLPRNYAVEQDLQKRLSDTQSRVSDLKEKALRELQRRAELLRAEKQRSLLDQQRAAAVAEADMLRGGPRTPYGQTMRDGVDPLDPSGDLFDKPNTGVQKYQSGVQDVGISPIAAMLKDPATTARVVGTEAATWLSPLDWFGYEGPGSVYSLNEALRGMNRPQSIEDEGRQAAIESMVGTGAAIGGLAFVPGLAALARQGYGAFSRWGGRKLRDAYFNARYPHHENVYTPPPLEGLTNMGTPKMLPPPTPQVARGPGAIARSQQEYFDQELPKINAILEEIMNPRRDMKPQIKGLSPYGEWLDSAENLPMRVGGSV